MSDLLLDGLAVLFTDGRRESGAAAERRSGASGEDQGRDEHELRGARIAARVAAELLDEQSWGAIVSHHVQSARDDGILGRAPG